MEIELVQCLIRLNQNGHYNLTQIVRAGPGAVPVTEIPILRMKHDMGDGMTEEECSINRAQVVGSYETTKAQEFERLRLKYGEKDVAAQYPQGRMMPSTLADCELPKGSVIAVKRKPKGPSLKEMRDKLVAAGVTVPDGNLTKEDYEAMAEDIGLELT